MIVCDCEVLPIYLFYKYEPMTVQCIDDSNKPADCKLSKWVKKGETYTVIEVITAHPQNVQAFKLEEIDTDGEVYEYFAASRFAPSDEISDKELEAMLDDVLTIPVIEI